MAQQRETHRQAMALDRAAEAHTKAARSNHIRRLAEREAAQKTADYFHAQLKTHGPRTDLDVGLRNAEFDLKMASVRVEATAKVVAQAYVAYQAASVAAATARQDVERVGSAKLQYTTEKDDLANLHRQTDKPDMRTNGKSAHATECQDARTASNWDRGAGLGSRQSEKHTRGAERERGSREEAGQKHREEEGQRQREATRNLMDVRRRRHEAQQRSQASANVHKLPSIPNIHKAQQRTSETQHAQEQEEMREERQRSYEQHRPETQHKHSLHSEPSVLARPQLSHILWKMNVERAFSDYSAIKVFPEPPKTGKCSNSACFVGQSQRALKACVCDIEAAFTLLQMPLKEARLAWHPDRWSKCPEENREVFQIKAKEVFQVVMKLYSEEKA